MLRQASLLVGGQGQGVGGAADGRVGDGARLVGQVVFREDLPAVVPRPVRPQAGKSLQVTFNPLVSGSGTTFFSIGVCIQCTNSFPLKNSPNAILIILISLSLTNI